MEEVFVVWKKYCSSKPSSVIEEDKNYYHDQSAQMDLELSEQSDYSDGEPEIVTRQPCKLNFSESEQNETSFRDHLPVSKKKLILPKNQHAHLLLENPGLYQKCHYLNMVLKLPFHPMNQN